MSDEDISGEDTSDVDTMSDAAADSVDAGPGQDRVDFKELSLARLVFPQRPLPSTEAAVSSVIQQHMEEFHEFKLQTVASDQWASPSDYKLKIYASQKAVTDRLSEVVQKLTNGKCTLQSAFYRCLLFLYRIVGMHGAAEQWEVFVLLAGHGAFTAISSVTDFAFPVQVARRLLEPSFIRTDAQHIGSGNRKASTDRYKEGQTTWSSQLDWIRSCHARLRDDSSLRQYPPFAASPRKQKEFNVAINVGSVRFKTKFVEWTMWPALLHP